MAALSLMLFPLVFALISQTVSLHLEGRPLAQLKDFGDGARLTGAERISFLNAQQRGHRRPVYANNYTEFVQGCLAGKKVTMLGNSVSRHWYFVLRDMLRMKGKKGPPPPLSKHVNRSSEIMQCGRGGNHGGKRPGQGPCFGMCGCSIDAGPKNDTTLQFLWQQRVFDAQEGAVLRGECPDLLTINAGGDDIFDKSRRPDWNQTLHEQSSQLASMLQSVLAACPQTHLYWRTTTVVCRTKENPSPYGLEVEDLSHMIEYSNAVLKQVVSTLPRTQVFDSWGKSIGRCNDYNDNIHSDTLVDEHVHDLLSDFCSGDNRP